METKHVSVSAIVADFAWNIRQSIDEKADADLLASVTKDGILQNLGVLPLAGEKFRLVWGFRRFHAAQKIGLKTVPVSVLAVKPQDVELQARVWNGVENLQRSELKQWEIANLLFELKSRHKLSTEKAIALLSASSLSANQKTGEKDEQGGFISRSYADNLLAIKKGASPALWKKFSEFSDGAPYQEFLRAIKESSVEKDPAKREAAQLSALAKKSSRSPASPQASPHQGKGSELPEIVAFIERENPAGGEWAAGAWFAARWVSNMLTAEQFADKHTRKVLPPRPVTAVAAVK